MSSVAAAAKTTEIFAQCKKVRSAENQIFGSTRTACMMPLRSSRPLHQILSWLPPLEDRNQTSDKKRLGGGNQQLSYTEPKEKAT
mmetsp:Transcript_25837/g.56189  ORF Transcript_25837/g.56189 Transcript_25837/m.56189 type:complete len:85 (-) Transcript_25837:3-257(-)